MDGHIKIIDFDDDSLCNQKQPLMNPGSDSCTTLTKLYKGKFEIYPKPTSNVVNIVNPPSLQEKDITLKLFDLLGQEIMRQSINIKGKVLKLNLLTVESGLYSLVIEQAREKIFQEIIVISK